MINDQPMNNIVTKRFIDSLKQLKGDGRIRSYRQFSLSVDYAPQSLSDIINGKRDVTVELIRKSALKYRINTHYLFTGEGEPFQSVSDQSMKILTIYTDDQEDERIAYVPVSAQAGYGEQLVDPSYMEGLISFRMPGNRYHSGTYRCFDISGDSMEPQLYSGDQVICKYVELDRDFSNIKDNHVYVVVTLDSVVVKRVVKTDEPSIGLMLISDNNFYDPYTIKSEDVREIWEADVKISEFSPCNKSVSSGLESEVEGVKRKLDNQTLLIKKLSRSLDSIVKRNRSTL